MPPRRASGPLVLGLAQVNPTVGDLAGNLRLIADVVAEARRRDVGLLVLPEMVVSGYPPEDLLLREDFLADCRVALTRVAAMSDEMPILCGFPERTENDVFNALAVCSGGEVVGVYHKAYLPNYGVFDERRYHSAPDPREAARLIRVDGRLVGLTICEDIWYPGPPLSDETLAGAELVVNVSASPYRVDVARRREEMIATRCRDNLCAIAYCNMVGGQDELVFDGASMVVDHEGRVTARAPQFIEDLLVAAIDFDAPRAARLRDTRYRQVPREREVPVIAEVSSRAPATGRTEHASSAEAVVAPLLDREAEVYAALTLGVRDYVRKSGFGHVVLGLSGGVDSALVATVAADALGAEHVTAVVMPSPHSSRDTQDDARRLARGLGVELREIPIAPLMDAYREVLAPQLRGASGGPDVTEENIQARIRGNLLMALSNRFSWLLLTTGNKSEMSVGYATLYGDMAGGFAVVKDVPKQLVFALARWRNRRGEVIPQSIIDRPPSAELKPDQRDTDSLPPYEVLDPVLALYVEEDESPNAIVASGLPEEVVGRVVGLVDRAEYKRRQAPPGIKITARAFGRDRRMPVVNRYRAGMLGEVPPEHPPAAARDAETAARREGFDGSAAAARPG